jgi:hypothetical protein
VATAQILNGAARAATSNSTASNIRTCPGCSARRRPARCRRAVEVAAGARGGGQRLFAFGADAWRLVAYFERLYNDPAFASRRHRRTADRDHGGVDAHAGLGGVQRRPRPARAGRAPRAAHGGAAR